MLKTKNNPKYNLYNKTAFLLYKNISPHSNILYLERKAQRRKGTIMNNQVHSALSGTQTHKNLTDAFGGEARSSMRYRIFANTARESGDPILADMLEKISDQELEHAELWMRYLGEIGNNIQNMENLVGSEEYETEVMYPEYANTASEEGFSEISQKMYDAANAEKGHMTLLTNYLNTLKNGTRFENDEEVGWLCTNCGYSLNGRSAPDRCPLCSYPRGYFVTED